MRLFRAGADERRHRVSDSTQERDSRVTGRERAATTSYQVVSPDGELIAVWDTNVSPSIHYGRHLVAFLKSAVWNSGLKPPRVNVDAPVITPYRGVGLPDDGTARLALTTRRTDQTGPDKWLMVDTLVVSTEELDALRPPEMEVGLQYTLPALTSRRVARICVHADSLFAVKPHEVTAHELNAVVSRVDDEFIEVLFQGRLGLETSGQWERTIGHGDGYARGRLRFSWRGELQELLLVYEGHFHNLYSRRWDPEYPVKGIIEWRLRR